jgi:hydroxypyruvate isomerase
MAKIGASISFLFNEWPFEQRFELARRAGFRAIEYGVPYRHDQQLFAHLLQRHGLQYLNFLAAPGDWDSGERGFACDPGRVEEFRAEFERAVAWAQALKVGRLHAPAGRVPPGCDGDRALHTLRSNLRWAAERAASEGLDVMIEPVNRHDLPGFAIHTVAQALELLHDIDQPNLGLIFDVYHVGREEGDVTARLREALPWVMHVQVGSPPDRHEPGCGEIDVCWLIGELDRLGYGGWVGCEYRPSRGTALSLDWARGYGIDPDALREAAA